MYSYIFSLGNAVAQWLRFCSTNRKVAGSIPDGVSGSFIDIKYFRSHYGPGVDSASNRNEYQYMKEKFKVRLDRGETRSVNIGRGVRQGCCLSPILFNLNSECLTKEALDGLGDFKV